MAAAADPTGTLAGWLRPFSALFTRPTWRHVLVLVAGAILAPHRRTVSAALRATGREQTAAFARYHDGLNRNRWSALAVRPLRQGQRTALALGHAARADPLGRSRLGIALPDRVGALR